MDFSTGRAGTRTQRLSRRRPATRAKSGGAGITAFRMPNIHPTAIIDAKTVELADDVAIGAYSVLEGRISIASGTTIGAHCVVHGHTVIGKNCKIGPAAYVGMDAQHLGYDGSETSLIIGDDVIIRETVSLHRSIRPGI